MTTPRERPILFSTPLVQAILAGTKTETRRPIKGVPDAPRAIYDVRNVDPRWVDLRAKYGTPSPLWRPTWDYTAPETGERFFDSEAPLLCPFGSPGDLLYVRESATVDSQGQIEGTSSLIVRYEADGAIDTVPLPARIKQPRTGHKLANGAYKEAARIWLRVTEVRVERLKDITETGAIAEGVTPSDAEGASNAWGGPHRWGFMRTWARIYGDDVITAGANPWVWVVRFGVISTTGRPS